jgi:L,D-peptidoglycan transpeptidase YkuD (ErfK/YbiS/YcfS/YnhG family)
MPARASVLALLLTAAVLGTLSGCGGAPSVAVDDQPAPVRAGAQPEGTSPTRADTRADRRAEALPLAEVLPEQLPGVGPHTLARVPENARQVVLVTGRGKNSPLSSVVLYERTPIGWQAGAKWAAHNALHGWTNDHHVGDLRSPIGVFTLTDAGGLLPDPGSELPYDRSTGFTIGGTGFENEPLAGSFDYVVAIDYNRKPGRSPLDWTRPLGASKGGGIWLHVDHGGPTHGCVSLSKAHMRTLLRTLDPSEHPVVVMGDAASIER